MRKSALSLSLALLCLLTPSCNFLRKQSSNNNTAVVVEESFPEDSAEYRGQQVFIGEGRCSSCHSLAPNTTIVGPTLANIATTAATRIPGLSAEQYLLQSILLPDAYKPTGFENTQMDSSLAKQLSSQQVDDVIRYLLSLE